jgi:polar amino acid transport system substrate-binding protein
MVTRRDFASMFAVGGAAAAALAGPAIAQTADAAETTFARVRRTRKLRIAGIVGTEPYYHKDIATGEWSGFCVSMAKDLAKSLEAEMEITETTWGNAVLDLQSNKIDIMFGLSPTPTRALVVEFSRPIMYNSFTIIAKPSFAAKTWADLDRSSVRVAVDIGSTHDLFARRVLPNCTLVALKTPDEAMMAVQTGRADCVVQVVMLSLVTVKKNPAVGRILLPTPLIQQPTCCGVRVETDPRFRSFVDNWLEYNRAMGTIRGWITENLALVGVKPEDVPPEVQF